MPEPTEDSPAGPTFRDLGLSEAVLKALDAIGYESPSSIQAQTIPHVLERRDVVGQAQTGTGKTAAFALPLLSRLDLKRADPQVLVLVPTRELAIQVAEAFQKYAAHMPGFHVLPIYGGQGYAGQLRQLGRGTHVVVGTPGRLCDHLRRGTLKLDALDCMVIDEADEMLRMGFIDEVEWILEQTPETRQTALFSATMPEPIRRIARHHLKEPVEVTVKAKTTTASTIRQRYWMVSGLHKLDALTRILEGEEFDAMLVFVRTKNAAVELAERLEARGFGAAPLNGDIPQNQREATVEKLRNGTLDILVATDVAARGLDVARITHVVNYDIPGDTESYVHRIGRTGRAGRTGQAILFVSPREKRLLFSIEKATNQRIEPMTLPSTDLINDVRITKFKQRITDTLAVEELGVYYQLVEQYQQEHNVPALEIAAALARLLQGDTPILLEKPFEPAKAPRFEPRDERPAPGAPHGDGDEEERNPRREHSAKDDDIVRERYRLDVGRIHDVKPGQIVGAIANEAGLEGRYIGRVDIRDDCTYVELPEGMPPEIFKQLRRARVCGRPLAIEKAEEGAAAPRTRAYEKRDDAERKPPFRKEGKPSFKSDKPAGFKKNAPFKGGAPKGPKKPPSGPRKVK